MRDLLVRFGFGLLLVLMGVVVFVIVPSEILGPRGMPKLRSLQGELDSVSQECDRYQAEIQKLDKEIRSLRDDPSAIERIARDELGMIKEGEIIYQFKPSQDSPSTEK